MTDTHPVIFRYVGKNGEFYRSVPARDLTQVDYDRLGLIEQHAVDTGALYKRVETKKADTGKKEGGNA